MGASLSGRTIYLQLRVGQGRPRKKILGRNLADKAYTSTLKMKLKRPKVYVFTRAYRLRLDESPASAELRECIHRRI